MGECDLKAVGWNQPFPSQVVFGRGVDHGQKIRAKQAGWLLNTAQTQARTFTCHGRDTKMLIFSLAGTEKKTKVAL